MALKLLLLGLVLAIPTACFGPIDSAREAGERAADGEAQGGQDKATPREADPEISTALPASEATVEEQAQEAVPETAATDLVLDPKWYKDSDGNIVPDFIEREADDGAGDDNPYKDDCAPENCPAAAESVEFITRPRNALLILDSSGSMATEAGDGRTRMEAAKDSLSRYSRISSALFETGFAVYGHTGNATKSGKAESCRTGAETLLPLGELDPDTFGQTLDGFEPTGWTPIEGALREAEGAFAGKEGEVNRVVLVSDGIETCGGDPVEAARELNRSGIEVEVDVVGFGVPGEEAAQLRQVALAGGGEYYDAQTGADLDGYFRKQSEALGQTWDAFTCQLRNSAFDSFCDAEQCQDATVFRIPEEQRKYDVNSPEYQALQELSDRITAGFEERERARREARAKADRLYEQWDGMSREYYRAYEEAYGA